MTDKAMKALGKYTTIAARAKYGEVMSDPVDRDAKRLSFQKQMVKRVRTLLDKSSDPRRLDGIHVEYLYWPDLNFGKLFKQHVRFNALEKAYLEAHENAQYKDLVALIVSRPHDNYYIVTRARRTGNVNPDAPILYLNIGGGDGHHVVVMNLKDYLWL